MDDRLIISVYGSHNAAVAMYYKGQYTIIELERWLNVKNTGLLHYYPVGEPDKVLGEIVQFLLDKTDRNDIDLYITNFADAITDDPSLKCVSPGVPYKEYYRFDHHSAHAACSFYQSPYEEALTFTFDGGGDNGYFNVYKTDRNNGVELIKQFDQDLGFAYMILADHLEDIRRDSIGMGSLVYAGKLMGLCSYGNIRQEWLPAFNQFYEFFNYKGDSLLGGVKARQTGVPWLMNEIGISDFTPDTRFSGQLAWDIAATTQYVFEEQFYKFAQPFLDEYPNMPVTLSGGCGLNVLLNARLLKERNGKVFVPPNPNDCGIAIGGLLLEQKPQTQVDITYAGCPILDEAELPQYISTNNISVRDNVTINDLATELYNGKIIGIVEGDSEHGPRALGHRSILCNPVGDMKDVLNAKVKNREWYRPFAPVVRLEDVHTYFNFPEGADSRHMTFVAEVRDEYKEVIPAVTHEDGTGRLQTVAYEQNEFLYLLLTAFDSMSEHGVLLNTSFNVNGKPILTRLSDAFHILTNTQLDAIYYKEKLYYRR